jgi:hypothetical protein
MIRSHTMAADAEALLWPGKKRKARVAILYPRSSFVWDQWSAAPPGSGKYPGGISDGGNKYIDGHTMDYQIDADFIYLALTLAWNVDVFWIDEGALTTDSLAPFKVVIVTEPCIPKLGQSNLLAWIKQGGTLITTMGASGYDEYNEPSSVLIDGLGIKRNTPPGVLISSLDHLNISATGTVGPGLNVTAWGDSESSPPSKTGVVAQFGGGEAALLHAKVDAGQTFHFPWHPGVSVARAENLDFNLKTYGQQDTLSPGIGWLLRNATLASGIVPAVTSPAAAASGDDTAAALPPYLYVETPVLDSEEGTLVTILNWRNSTGQQFPLSVAVNFTVGKVVSALLGSIPFTQQKGAPRVSFVLPTLPNITDFISISRKNSAGREPLKNDDGNELPAGRPTLLLTNFGGLGDGHTNNAASIKSALRHCEQLGGCRLVLPPTAAGGSDGPTVYRSSAFNLTSRLELVVPAGVVLRATETDEHNLDEGSWPTLARTTAPAPCAGLAGTCDCGPAKQAWIRGFGLQDVTLTGGGTLHGGGRYWWCIRQNLADGSHRPYQPAMEASGCATQRALPNWTLPDGRAGATCPPRLLHILESERLVVANLTVLWSPYWTLHFQYSSGILVEGVHVWNPTNESFNAMNADGIDIDSSENAHVRNSTIDVADDALCIKSGEGWIGRHVGRPTRHVLFEDIEVRNGHGLTVGSDASGGVHNVTWRNIRLTGRGPTCSAEQGRASPPGLGCGNGWNGAGPGGPHWKTGRGRGGLWTDLTWEGITGDSPMFAVGFLGGDYIRGPRANASATPQIANVVVRDMALTNVQGSYQGISTLPEAPIKNLTLRNISFVLVPRTGCKICAPTALRILDCVVLNPGCRPWTCWARDANGTNTTPALHATGTAVGVSPPLSGPGYDCSFTNITDFVSISKKNPAGHPRVFDARALVKVDDERAERLREPPAERRQERGTGPPPPCPPATSCATQPDCDNCIDFTPRYTPQGSYDMGTCEATPFFWKKAGKMMLMEGVCTSATDDPIGGYWGHAGLWDRRYDGHSYIRVRELESGVVVSNISQSIGWGFPAAVVDYDAGRLWITATPFDRVNCHRNQTYIKPGCTPVVIDGYDHGGSHGHGVSVFSSSDLTSWTGPEKTDVSWSGPNTGALQGSSCPFLALTTSD